MKKNILLLSFFLFFIGSIEVFRFAIYITVFLPLIIALFQPIKLKGLVLCLSLCLTLIFLGVLSNAEMDINIIISIMLFIGSIIVAHYLRINGEDALYVSKVMFFTMNAFVLITYTFSLMQGYSYHEYINSYFIYSRNFIAYYAFVITVLYIMVRYKVNGIVYFWPSVVMFIYALMLYGRSGVIVSLLFFIATLFKSKLNKNNTRKYIIPAFLVLLIILISMIYNMDSLLGLIKSLFEETNFSKTGLRSARSLIYSEYFSNFDVNNFIFGVDVRGLDYTWNELDGNLHNSYMYLHSRFGLFSVLMISVFFIFTSISFYFDWYIAFVLVLVFFRAALDIIAFPSQMDFICFLLLLYFVKFPLKYKKLGV